MLSRRLEVSTSCEFVRFVTEIVLSMGCNVCIQLKRCILQESVSGGVDGHFYEADVLLYTNIPEVTGVVFYM